MLWAGKKKEIKPAEPPQKEPPDDRISERNVNGLRLVHATFLDLGFVHGIGALFIR